MIAILPRLRAPSLALLAAFAFQVASAQTTIWNPATVFSITSGNPNGVWTYGWMNTSFTTFTPYTTNLYNSGIGNSPQWYGPLGGDLTPTIWYNTSASSYFGVAPGQISLHPGPGGEPSVLRWTAPSGFTGSFDVTGQFFAGDGGAMQVAVRQGSSVWWSATDAGAFSFVLGVSPGDTLDFAVFGGYSYGNTPLAVTITGTAVPEPAAWTMLAGLVGLGVAGRREWIRRDTGRPTKFNIASATGVARRSGCPWDPSRVRAV